MQDRVLTTCESSVTYSGATSGAHMCLYGHFLVSGWRGNFLNTREHMRSSSPIWIWLELYTGMHVPLCVFVLASDVHYFLPEQELSKPWQIIYKDLANR